MQYIKMTKAAVIGAAIATSSLAAVVPVEANALSLFSKSSKGGCLIFCSKSSKSDLFSKSSKSSKSSTSTSTSGGSTSTSTSGSSTSTSGGGTSTSGGGTSTSGGTPVPAPGAALLFGAGAFAAMGGRRLVKKKKSA